MAWISSGTLTGGTYTDLQIGLEAEGVDYGILTLATGAVLKTPSVLSSGIVNVTDGAAISGGTTWGMICVSNGGIVSGLTAANVNAYPNPGTSSGWINLSGGTAIDCDVTGANGRINAGNNSGTVSGGTVYGGTANYLAQGAVTATNQCLIRGQVINGTKAIAILRGRRISAADLTVSAGTIYVQNGARVSGATVYGGTALISAFTVNYDIGQVASVTKLTMSGGTLKVGLANVSELSVYTGVRGDLEIIRK